MVEPTHIVKTHAYPWIDIAKEAEMDSGIRSERCSEICTNKALKHS